MESHQTKTIRRISHVKILVNSDANEPSWETIYDPKEIESHILQQHQKHFSQAHGTIFTQALLSNLINDSSASEYAQQILAGTTNIDSSPIDKSTKALLTNLKIKVPQMTTLLTH